MISSLILIGVSLGEVFGRVDLGSRAASPPYRYAPSQRSSVRLPYGKVERSHRSDQETLYDSGIFISLKDLRKKVARWNTEYNNLEHCGLGGKTPNEFLAEFKSS